MNCRKRTIFGDYGCEFVDEIELGEITAEQKMLAERVIEGYYQPLSKIYITL